MKSFASARSLPLVCVFFVAMGTASPASAAMPSAAGLPSTSTRPVTMTALPHMVQPASLWLNWRIAPASTAIALPATPSSRIFRLTLSLSGIYPVLPVGLPAAVIGLRVHQALKATGRHSVQGAVLQRTARSAGFAQASGVEEPSLLLVLGTCLLASAAALFRKMKS
jgi:hypothetical protein